MINEKEVNQDPNSPLIYLKGYGLINIKKVVRVTELYQRGQTPFFEDSDWYYCVTFNEKYEFVISEEELKREDFINKWVKFI